jgi:integrase
MWIATLGGRGFETGSTSIEGEPLGHCRLVGKGGRIRTVPVPNWCRGLVDVWLRQSGLNEGKVLRWVLKNGARQDAGVPANVVWYAVKRCAQQAGIDNLAPHDLRAKPTSAPSGYLCGITRDRVFPLV